MSKKPLRIAIPVPYLTLESLHQVAMVNKEATEIMLGQRGNKVDAAVTWGDLLDLGLIKQEQMPG